MTKRKHKPLARGVSRFSLEAVEDHMKKVGLRVSKANITLPAITMRVVGWDVRKGKVIRSCG